MSALTCSIADYAEEIHDQSKRLLGFGPAMTQPQAEESVLAIRLAVARLSALIHHLPAETGKDAVGAVSVRNTNQLTEHP